MGDSMTPNTTGNGWDEWRRHVLLEMDRLGKACETHNTQLGEIKAAVEALKVKAGTWGAVAGLVTALGAWLLRSFAN